MTSLLLTILLAIGIAGVPRAAEALTWYRPLCVDFAACNRLGYGNDGYEYVYRTTGYWNMYSGHNCTNYVAYRLQKRGIKQFTIPGQGNAHHWGRHARNAGYAVDMNPRVGDVAWWNNTKMGSAGHVAIVESIDRAAGTMVVSEDHWSLKEFNWRTYRISEVSGFIHVGGDKTAPEGPTAPLVEAPAPVLDPVIGSVPAIAGTAFFGEQLTVDPGAWDPADATLAYQWLRDGMKISGATGTSYMLAAEDVGAQLTVRVTGSRSGLAETAIDSEPTETVKGFAQTLTGAPTISGTAQAGEVLTADPGAWDADATLAYQWLRDGSDIEGAEEPTYAIAGADVGAKVSVRVTASKPGYDQVSGTSTATATVKAGTLTATPTPAVSGTAAVGKTLTAKGGSWEPATVSLSYQWLRDGKNIQGATSSSYTLTSSDKGTKVSVRVTGSKSGYTSVSKTSKATAKVKTGKLTATPTPTISGTVRVGYTLTAKTGTWAPSKVTLSYQWLRDGKPIQGATKSTYILTAKDHGAKMSLQVKGAKKGFSSVWKTSKKTDAVKPGWLWNTPVPTISGSATVGSKLTAKAGTWTPGKVTLTYSWLRDGKVIDGATKSTYTLTPSDKGTKISVQVKGSKTAYTTAWKTSKQTAKVKGMALEKTPTPTVSGSAIVGETLTAKAGTWAPSPVKLTYQWLRGGEPIDGANTATYVVTGADQGSTLAVQVTGSKSGYSSVTTVSAVLAVIPSLGLPAAPA
ncbi:CHAP domain-containing protein [Tessaracoccus caeni]|uniref:CHAP domain-containing protein n=1 Tax=Tessaracoccus caeni TaxID=3031239 RepID=UPI0023DA1200|nr:CHAP domain-containing protein [Tessaracoccus caeni]MDF1490332.1 CHAP domain-containing protein [Tessaracoccus caeni]